MGKTNSFTGGEQRTFHMFYALLSLLAVALAARVADISIQYSDVSITGLMCLAKNYEGLSVSTIEGSVVNPRIADIMAGAVMSGFNPEKLYGSVNVGSKGGLPDPEGKVNTIDPNTVFIIVDTTGGWLEDTTVNCAALKKMVEDCTQDSNCAIGADYKNWVTIMGSADACPMSGINLWWREPDGAENLGGFRPFGGFTTNNVIMKQVDSHRSVCGTIVGDNVVM